MIIPVKCFTCGKVIGNKYRYYQSEVRRINNEQNKRNDNKLDNNVKQNEVIYLTKDQTTKTTEGIVMDTLGLNRVCCRRHMLTHIDIE